VSLVVHLSDLHLLSGGEDQAAILSALPLALASEQARRDSPVELLAITGDVFDSGTLEPERAVNAFLELYERLINALGRPVPSVIVPGNHDRRLYGMFGPHRTALFERLARDFAGQGWVHGAGAHFLAGVVPEALHPLPAWILTYDSTYLPLGLLSAGGALREEDLARGVGHLTATVP
jgi:3',5'-cyclic AMP phosphodiesterase CpdA